MFLKQVGLCSPVRTVIDAYGGFVKEEPATKRGATVARATLARVGLGVDGGQGISLALERVT